MSTIGIDLGTGSVKLLLVDEQGNIQRETICDYPILFPQPGWAEQNPEDWWKAVCAAMAELLDGADVSHIRGIGVGGQMHGLVALDKCGCVIRPCILWNDGRTEQETAWLNETVGRKRLTALTGNIAFAGFTVPKLLWMKAHEPEPFSRINKILLPKDYLVYRLTGQFSSEPSDASGTLLYDVEHQRWSKEMLALCGLVEEQLPPLHKSAQAVGRILPELATEFGLPADVLVCAGAGDNAAAAVGCGVVGPGKCNISLGTSGTVFLTGEHFFVDPHNALHSFAHADGGYHQMGCILSAASCNQWWLEKILHTTDYTASQSKLERLGENSVFFLPYLMGERSPHNDVNVRGAFVGLSMDTSREKMTQAVLEGVAFAIRDCVESARAQGIDPRESMLCGGGAKSRVWARILANVLNMTLTVPETEQGPAYGAAILAAVCAGTYISVEACCRAWVHIRETVEPEPTLLEKYETQYERWRTLYPALKKFYSGGHRYD